MEGLDQGGSITLGVDENSLTLSPEQIRILSEMNEKGQLSLHTLWQILDRADQLPDDFDEADPLGRNEGKAVQLRTLMPDFDVSIDKSSLRTATESIKRARSRMLQRCGSNAYMWLHRHIDVEHAGEDCICGPVVIAQNDVRPSEYFAEQIMNPVVH